MKPVLCLGDICVDLIIPYAAALKAKAGGLPLTQSTDAHPVDGGSVANTRPARSRGWALTCCFAALAETMRTGKC